jgi:hypothetical protein
MEVSLTRYRSPVCSCAHVIRLASKAAYPPVAEVGWKGDEVGVRGRCSIIDAVEISEAVMSRKVGMSSVIYA